MSQDELAALVRMMDDASVRLHAAMLHFDATAGQLRQAVQDIEWERAQNRMVFDGLRLVDGIMPDSRHHSLAGEAAS